MSKKFPISNFQFPRNSRGFTLIELLVVIGILGVLVALSFPNFFAARERARDAARKSDLKQIQKALEIYKLDQTPGAYPTVYPAAGTYKYINVTCSSPWTGVSNTYMPKMPCDPQGTTAAPTPYFYQPGATVLQYTLIACLENASDPDKDATCNTACNGGAACVADQASYTLTEP